ncbi:MAG: exosortase/archaeosortase family protein [Candidatus Marinimicrobia bacterium]|nr:exosortase/archaeosortase family protein [Candidatus Neomarinimicrobiota bacterium]
MMKETKRFSLEKQTFVHLFLILVLVLMLMPFLSTFNDLLTQLVMRLDFYRLIQKVIVPWEIRMVGILLLPFGFKPAIMGEYLAITRGGNPLLIEIIWNCIGWQSLLFFLITTFVGLQGDKYTNFSKFKALVIGLLGTFLVNLFRIAVVVLVAYRLGQNVAIIFHDYGSTLAVIVWLFGFWWFSYSFVLEER